MLEHIGQPLGDCAGRKIVAHAFDAEKACPRNALGGIAPMHGRYEWIIQAMDHQGRRCDPCQQRVTYPEICRDGEHLPLRALWVIAALHARQNAFAQELRLDRKLWAANHAKQADVMRHHSFRGSIFRPRE